MRARPQYGRNNALSAVAHCLTLVIAALGAARLATAESAWTAPHEYVELERRLHKRSSSPLTHPHEVAFHAFGRHFVLVLREDRDFLPPGLHVQHVSANTSHWTPLRLLGQEEECFYSGHVDGEDNSVVALSLCHPDGLLAHFRTSHGRFFLEPSPSSNASRRHVIYRHLPDDATQHCATPESSPPHRRHHHHRHHQPHQWRHGGSAQSHNASSGWKSSVRRKRSISLDLHVEVMVVADSKMQQYHGNNLHNYVLTLMSIVALIYKDPSIGNSLNIAVVKLVTIDRYADQEMISTSATKTLKNFCRWQNQQNDPQDSSPLHHDTAILLTREDICRSPRKCDTLGLAELGTMCDDRNSCSIIEDNGMSAAFTIAHELGHVLSMPHDDDNIKCHLYNKGRAFHVMSRMLDFHTQPWSWSACSAHYLTEFLDADSAYCLMDKPMSNKLDNRWARDKQPGELFDANKQCQLVYGSESRICTYMPSCKLLWCVTNEAIGCRTHHMPWADGTRCDDQQKWCQKGECKKRDPNALRPVNGHWARWGKFGNCSRPCGGGIQQAFRQCNRPRPVNGGKYCVGRRTRYRSCHTKPCPPGSPDFREEQCAAFNGKQYHFHGLPPNVSWLPVYAGINPKDRCKLFCRVVNGNAYYALKEKVVDGTPCGPDTFDICVNGLCKPAGCDFRMGSNKKLDHCGVCGGDNSTCDTVSGYKNDRLIYGYTTVVRIPAGASNIDIRQQGYNNSEKDDNYIALKTPEDEYILNGNFSVILFKKLIPYGGTILEYTGAGMVIERVNSSKPLQKDLIVQILSVKDLLPPDMHYQYTVSKGFEFEWELLPEWTECSSFCQGERYREAVCIRKSDRKPAGDSYCWELVSRPPKQKERCNTHCNLVWRVTHKSECSVHCGNGTRTLRVQCVQLQTVDLTRESRIIDDRYCSHLPVKPDSKEKCFEPCTHPRWEYGEWSKCSSTCDEGVQTRSATCVTGGNDSFDETECAKLDLLTERTCNLSKCPTWKVGPWLHCSVSCGEGEQRRPYWCEVAGYKVHGSACDSLRTPDDKRVCHETACPNRLPEWDYGDWGQCSSTCGNGISERVVRCRSAEGTLLDDSECIARDRPDDVMGCPLPPCSESDSGLSSSNPSLPNHYPLVVPPTRTKKKWRSGPWGECSTTCGDSIRKRNVMCYDEDRGIALKESECDAASLVRPTAVEICHRKPCGRWRTGEWTQCSVTCGGGLQTRSVICFRSDTRQAVDSECEDQERPVSEQLCNTSVACPEEDPITSNLVDASLTWRTGPWGRCSRTCGRGYKLRQVVCQDESGKTTDGCDVKRKPGETVTCNSHACPTWATSNWGACTRTCGTGVQRRRVSCQDQQGEEVPARQCDGRVRPFDEQACNSHACGGISVGRSARWQAGPWTSCSVTCGQGFEERQVACVDEAESRVISPSNCNGEPPETRQNCSASDCPRWQLDVDWTECSLTCGTGSQQLRPLCIHGNATVEDGLCSGLPPPTQRRPCNTHACFTHWTKGEWSQCDHGCGRGRQVRVVHCVDSDGSKVDDDMCDPSHRPRGHRGCNKHPCPFVWQTGYWSDCSTSCGPGIQKRDVDCHQVNAFGWTNPEAVVAGCNETQRPPILQACNYGECSEPFQWKAAAWSNCFGACGKSHQRRRTFCMDLQHNVVPRRLCQRTLRPARKRHCFQRPCGNTSCADVQQQFDVREDGEQQLVVRGKVVQVFCADMNSSFPREYITLPSGESENFSEMYDKRLIRPDTCPYNGARRDSCECVDDARSQAGFTSFSKIRVNITQLRVFRHDFAFSRRVHGQLIPYAEAADCYSTANCPQGRFSINLVGTGFIVSEFTTWVGHGTKPSVKILQNQDGMRVQGHCGGYCGKCSVDPLIGLQLDVAPP